jgi:hypothetical protein
MKMTILIALTLAGAGTAWAATSQPILWASLHEPSCGGWLSLLGVSPHDRSRILLGGDILAGCLGQALNRWISFAPELTGEIAAP